jgi:hypothetical protein
MIRDFRCDVGQTLYYVNRVGRGDIIPVTCEKIVLRIVDKDKVVDYHFSELTFSLYEDAFGTILFYNKDTAKFALNEYRLRKFRRFRDRGDSNE